MVSRLTTDTLARVRACIGAHLPASPDLMADIEQCLGEVVGAAALKGRRDMLIRRAALLLPPAEPYAQAGALAREAKALARTWGASGCRRVVDEPTTPRECLQAAAQLAGLPESQRQFHRVLTKSPH